MTLKKTLQFAFVIFIVWFIAFRPDSAAKLARSIGAFIAQLGTGFGEFFTKVVG